jgi:hypothetical protein
MQFFSAIEEWNIDRRVSGTASDYDYVAPRGCLHTAVTAMRRPDLQVPENRHLYTLCPPRCCRDPSPRRVAPVPRPAAVAAAATSNWSPAEVTARVTPRQITRTSISSSCGSSVSAAATMTCITVSDSAKSSPTAADLDDSRAKSNRMTDLCPASTGTTATPVVRYYEATRNVIGVLPGGALMRAR